MFGLSSILLLIERASAFSTTTPPGRRWIRCAAEDTSDYDLKIPHSLVEKGFGDDLLRQNRGLSHPAPDTIVIHDMADSSHVRLEVGPWNEDDIYDLCQKLTNDVLLIEYFKTTRELVVHTPENPITNQAKGEVIHQLGNWERHQQGDFLATGICGYIYPDGSQLASVSCIPWDRIKKAAHEVREPHDYYRTTPTFVAETLFTDTDVEKDLIHEKMTMYMNLGVDLGWVIDPLTTSLTVYRPDQSYPKVLNNPTTVSGDPVLPGFDLNVTNVWDRSIWSWQRRRKE